MNVFQTCCTKEIMDAPIEYDRYIVIEIKIDDKNFSTLSEVSSAQRSQEQQRNENYQLDVMINHAGNSANTF